MYDLVYTRFKGKTALSALMLQPAMYTMGTKSCYNADKSRQTGPYCVALSPICRLVPKLVELPRSVQLPRLTLEKIARPVNPQFSALDILPGNLRT